MRPIDADYLKSKVHMVGNESGRVYWFDVEDAPTLDVKPIVHAHWDAIDADSEGNEAFVHTWATLRCSRCGLERTVEDDYVPQYCEDCGAKMDEEEKK